MELTTQQLQRRNALLRYPEALKNTRSTYLRLLEAPVVSEEDKNSIWAASFILKYMIANHEKYTRLLKSLSQDEQAQAILAKLYDQLTVDPVTDLQGFIDEAQKIMQGDEFNSNLQSLHDRYSTKNTACFIGGMVMAVAGMAAISIIIILLISSPLVILLALAAGSLFAAGSLRLVTLSMKEELKESHIERSIVLLNAEEPDLFSLTDEYSYQAVNADNISTSITVSLTHQPRLKTELRQAFFQPQMDDREALNLEVQAQFNLLTN